MILEVAVLDIHVGSNEAYERAFAQAAPIAHELRRCVEVQSRYILLVQWETLQAHTRGFRESAGYQQWKSLLHPFYDPFPTVEHYAAI
jgi:heme-degrading monooxygenase HmoA